jgi:predicted DCC family thiol-disulfide oxidoreductase YuxK
MNASRLTLYFDGNCPFCAAQMRRLKSWDASGMLRFVDIADPMFEPATLGVAMADLGRELHGRTASGQLLIGIDSIRAAYALVGRGWLVWPLRVKILRPVLAAWYRTFARNRYRFSRWLGYTPIGKCEDGSCGIDRFYTGR